MSHSKRDPRKDPQPGDALMYGPQWQRDRLDVTQRESGMVWFRRFSGGEGCFDLATWQQLMESAEVLNVAQ